MFVASKIIPLNMLYFKSVVTLMPNVFNNIPKKNMDLFTSLNKVHNYHTMSSSINNFYVNYTRLNLQKTSFSRIRVRIWILE
jgi:hypothetical protein